MPLTDESWSGFLLRVIRRSNSFDASSIGGVRIFPCSGGHDEEAAQRLQSALKARAPGKIPIEALHIGEPAPADLERVWYQAPGFWLERARAPEATIPSA